MSEHFPGFSGAVLELRPAVAADVADVVHIWREGWGDAHLGRVPAALISARTPASFAEHARECLAQTIIATRIGLVCGFVMIDGNQVDQLYLDRAARGSGVGAALLSAAEQAVIAAGHRAAWLAVATGNTSARRFYARQGWIDDGRFVNEAPVPGGVVAVDCHRFVSPHR